MIQGLAFRCVLHNLLSLYLRGLLIGYIERTKHLKVKYASNLHTEAVRTDLLDLEAKSLMSSLLAFEDQCHHTITFSSSRAQFVL